MTDDQTSCFVCGYVLDGDGGAREIDGPIGVAELAEGESLWLHIDYSFPDAETWLADQGLDLNLLDSLVRADSRPRSLTEASGTLLVLRGVNTNPGADPEDMVSIRVWLEPRRIISVRQRKLLSVVDIRTALAQGKGPRDCEHWLAMLLERLADRIAIVVDDIEEVVAEVETSAEEGSVMEMRSKISLVRRQTAAIRRFLAPQREALDSAYRNSRGTLSDATAFLFREQSDRIARYVEDLDLVRERTLVIQEELMNRLAQEQNQRMYVLSIVAAVFLPITFITGMFGMNVAGLPGVEDVAAFWIVVAIMTVVSLVIVALLRMKRWL
ncbi:MAG: zinc transporter ZntB [Gammaproteobacteria bacterium]|nr:zinc transporter ZntB [Gammaproteobacteria bacterium]